VPEPVAVIVPVFAPHVVFVCVMVIVGPSITKFVVTYKPLHARFMVAVTV
jgi:hypothetical protein